MTRLRHFSCYCGGLRWAVTPDFYRFGITKGFYRGMARLMGDYV